MTAPRFFLPPGSLDGARPGQTLELAGEEGRHAATVRRIRAGEQVEVADGSGRVATCVVEVVGMARLGLRVEVVVDAAARVPRLVLVQALAKGGRDEMAVESATELGADELVPWQAARSVVVWSGARGERSRQRWGAVALAAAKQSRRARLPVVAPLADLGAVRSRCGAASLALVLHEGAEVALTSLSAPAEGDVVLVVGPEGGIDDRELSVLTGAGALAVRLGPEVLRTSTAGGAAIAVLSALTGRW